MLIGLCIILVVGHTARIRRISPNGGLDYKDRVTYSGSLLDDPLVAGNRSTSLLQLKPFDDEKAKALAIAITERAIAQSRLTAKTERSLTAAEAALAAAIPVRAVAPSRRPAETQFEAALSAAIAEIMKEGTAAAKAAHDQVFHHGYYRAVKAETAAKAALEAKKTAIATASQQAKVSGIAVVLKTLLELTKSDEGASVNLLLEHAEKQVEHYVKKVREQFETYPEMVGLEVFLGLVKATDEQMDRVSVGLYGFSGTRKGQWFDSEATTKMILGLIQVMVKALYFGFQAKHKSGSTPRALHRDIKQEMSNKMKSEIALDNYLKAIAVMEKHLNPWREQVVKTETAAKRDK